MTTVDRDEDAELERSIAEADAERTQQRVTAARNVKALAKQRDQLAEQLNDIDQQLHRAVTSAREVFDLKELALHTKRRLPELAEWAEGGDGKSAGRAKSAGRSKSTRQDRRAPIGRADQPLVSPPSATPE
jgi:hypothetical protein